MTRKQIIYIVPLVIFLGLAGFAGRALLQPDNMREANVNQMIGKEAYGFEALRGQKAIINIFASWCAPCEAEHPLLTALAEEAPLYGINYKDETEDRRNYLKRLGNPYEKVAYDKNGIITAFYGINGIPATFVVDKKGEILYAHDGPVTEAESKEIRTLLESLE